MIRQRFEEDEISSHGFGPDRFTQFPWPTSVPGGHGRVGTIGVEPDERVELSLLLSAGDQSFLHMFKAEIVEVCQRGDRSVGQVARDVDLTETAVREWVKQVECDAGARDDGGLTTAERDELAALPRENRRLREDVDILRNLRGRWA